MPQDDSWKGTKEDGVGVVLCDVICVKCMCVCVWFVWLQCRIGQSSMMFLLLLEGVTSWLKFLDGRCVEGTESNVLPPYMHEIRAMYVN